MNPRMERIARILRSVAVIISVLGTIAFFSVCAHTNTEDEIFTVWFPGTGIIVFSVLGWWLLFGFVWALADFRVVAVPPAEE